MVSYADHHDTSPSLGAGCDLRNCRHFRGLLGGLAGVVAFLLKEGWVRPWVILFVKDVASAQARAPLAIK